MKCEAQPDAPRRGPNRKHFVHTLVPGRRFGLQFGGGAGDWQHPAWQPVGKVALGDSPQRLLDQVLGDWGRVGF